MTTFPGELIRNTLGHLHPALVHFPIGLVLTGAALEGWSLLRRGERAAATARVLLALGTLGAAAAALSGLSLFHPGDFRGRTLEAALTHRVLGLASLAVLLAAAGAGRVWSREGPDGLRLRVYRVSYVLAAVLIGLTGHYGGWVVFGWGRIWTFS